MSTSTHDIEKERDGVNGATSSHDHAHQEHAKQRKQHEHLYGAYGGNPLARVDTSDSVRLAAFGGDFQPGLYAPSKRKFANPAPLGLCAFALTTFLLALINLGTMNLSVANLVVGPAFGYGGLVQLLAGMWEMAVGNTFGATALSSYGGFWIGTAIILTPGGFEILSTYEAEAANGAGSFYDAFGLYLLGWFIFTFLLLLCTLKSTVAFFLLFFFLDMAFLLLGISYVTHTAEGPNIACERAGGAFAILSAFTAWYNAFAGIADPSNSFFVIPVAHFPWSDKGREKRGKVSNAEARAEQAELNPDA
ncbi:hypothetical protein K431DRAFT_315611 [Polychaeton citri CBS 116435]|uniref:Acetate permease A n=1 Tax=Polychaeton citri CBS 116435 TaxID=1314669 RepID=A0A9P4UJ54_9PEZI|nr:hypothetical protein K431DRAFT_315611 [Polychaeton citri CBS 116435]